MDVQIKGLTYISSINLTDAFSSSAVGNVKSYSLPLKVFHFNLSYSHCPGLFISMHFAFNQQCSKLPSPHLPTMFPCHYSHNHLMDFSLIITGSKVKLSIAFSPPLGYDLQNVPLHFWEATKQLELDFEIRPLPHVVYCASIRLY